MKTTGLIHVYCGNGKGKTTTGMGLCARAAGFGYKVLIYQFMKNNRTSERRLLEKSENIIWQDGPDQVKFSSQMTPKEKEERRIYYGEQLKKAADYARSQDVDVLFLDEAIYAIRAQLLDEELVLDFLDSKPEKLEVILTGQDPSERILERADYVSEICMRKHPYTKGIPARMGIER